MDEQVKARFQAALEAERNRIQQQVKRNRDELSTHSVETSGDEADQAQSMSEQHLSLRFKERDLLLLRKIEFALNRIKDGTFGECDDCGQQIGLKRLEIRPMATLCIGCKEAQEKHEKSYDAQV